MRVIIALAVLGLCTACSTTYNKPGATQAQFQQDLAACQLVSKTANQGIETPWDTHTCLISRGYTADR